MPVRLLMLFTLAVNPILQGRVAAQQENTAVPGAAILHSCEIGGLEVHVTTNEPGLSPLEVKQHILSTVGFVDPHDTYWACIDGRSTKPQLGTPGGDSGEFLAGLAVYDQYLQQRNQSITQAHVRFLFDIFLETLPPERGWYMHSDMASVQRIRAALNDSTFDPAQFVPPARQQTVLSVLINPKNIGCSHLRFMMIYYEPYQMPPQLVSWYLMTFYDFLWNEEDTGLFHHLIELEELEGHHEEHSVVFLYPKYNHLGPYDVCYGKAPYVAPDDKVNSMFIYHDGWVDSGLRAHIANFLASRINVPSSEFLNKMNELVAIQLQLTLNSLGSQPVYTATVAVQQLASNMMTVFSLLLIVGLLVTLFAIIAFQVRLIYKKPTPEECLLDP